MKNASEFWTLKTASERIEYTKEIEAEIEAIMAEETGEGYEPWTPDAIAELREWAYGRYGFECDPWEYEEPDGSKGEEDRRYDPYYWYKYNGVKPSDF